MADGASDEDWLGKLTGRDWAAISKDEHILQRPTESAAYKAARLWAEFTYPTPSSTTTCACGGGR